MKTTVGMFHEHLLLGELAYTHDRGREVCQFAYSEAWLSHEDCFQIDPELPLARGYFSPRKGPNVFFGWRIQSVDATD